jgi:hypothetical protein
LRAGCDAIVHRVRDRGRPPTGATIPRAHRDDCRDPLDDDEYGRARPRPCAPRSSRCNELKRNRHPGTPQPRSNAIAGRASSRWIAARRSIDAFIRDAVQAIASLL